MIILTLLLTLSVGINIFLFVYIRWLLIKLAFLSENIGDMLTSMTTFSKHLDAIHELETYYGDTTLGNLITHSKRIVEEIEIYKDIYTLFSDDDKELEKIFEKEGFYGKEQDKAEETEEE